MNRKLYILVIALLLFQSYLFSQTLTVETNFGTNGRTLTSFGSNDSNLGSLAIQSDGKIIACGSYYDSFINQMIISRYNTNGTIDTTFGTNGKAIAQVGTPLDNEYNSVKVLSSGKILVSGTNYNTILGFQFFVIRYNQNGTLDASFGTNGTLFSNLGFSTWGTALQIQSDNKFIVAGKITENSSDGYTDFFLVRYNENGTLDSGFGTNGIAKINIGTASNSSAQSEDILSCLNLQTDGKILASGSTNNGSDYGNFALTRLNTNGSIDTTFGNNGKVITDFGQSTEVRTLHILPDNTIIASGNYYYNADSNQKAVTAKYNANGTLDSSFGTAGKVITDLNGAVDGGLIFSSEILANGKLLLFGYINGSSDSDFLMIRYTTNGSIDNTFGTNGFLTTDFGTNEGAFSSLTQPDGKIIVGGGTYNTVSGAVDFTLLRYTIDALSTIDFKKEPLLAYPNPFTNSITINFDLDNNDVFDIDLYDINGRKVKNLLSTTSFNAGNTTRTLAVPENLVHGNYLLKITSSNESKVLKMVK